MRLRHRLEPAVSLIPCARLTLEEGPDCLPGSSAVVQRDVQHLRLLKVVVEPESFPSGLDDERPSLSHRIIVLQIALHRIGSADADLHAIPTNRNAHTWDLS